MYMKNAKRILSVMMAILVFATSVPVSRVHAQEQAENAQDVQTAENSLFVVVDKPYIETADTQTVVVGLADEVQADKAVLYYKNLDTDEEFTVEQDQVIEGAVSFRMEMNAQSGKGNYQICAMDYFVGNEQYHIDFPEEGVEAKFGVGQEADTEPDAIVEEQAQESVDYDIVSLDEDGNTISEKSIGEVLQESQEEIAKQPSALSDEIAPKTSNGNVVVMLDPGHDNTHAGARGNGLAEEELNLKIAQYCRDELQQYRGVTVYMTRNDDGSCPYPGTSSGDCNEKRVEYAKSVGANVYVSIHLNSASASANGAEVYYPNGNYNPSVGSQGQALASSIQDKLVALGLRDRGIKIKESQTGTTYPDGSLADYYGVIRNSKKQGIPAVIVEHAFLTNEGDVNSYLNSDDKLRSLGVADASAIAGYFGLSKGLKIEGIGVVQQENEIRVGCYYRSETPTSLRYLTYDVTQQTWTMISDWTTSAWVSWQPNPGEYQIYVEAVNSNSESANYTYTYNNGRNYSLTYVGLSDAMCVQQENGLAVGVAYDSLSAVQFRWLAYDLRQQQWELLSDWTTNNWVSWQPHPGDYWIYVEAVNSTGGSANHTTVYSSATNYSPTYMGINSVMCVDQGSWVAVGAAYDSLSSAQFRWTIYDLQKQQWELLSDWTTNNWVSWQPQSGNYWVHVEAKNSSGSTANQTIAYTPQQDYSKYNLDLQGMICNQNSDCIQVGTAYSNAAASVVFQWLVYDVDKGQWSVLSDWTTSNWVTWKPTPGNYWVHVTAVNSNGFVKEDTIAVSTTRDYANGYVEINGIYVKSNQFGYSMGASYVTSDFNTKIQWLVYKQEAGNWEVLSDWSTDNWTEWYPENGNYLLCAVGMTSKGQTSQYCMSYAVDNRTSIMGMSTTNLQQMVNYYNANAFYPSYYAQNNSGAPNIETFCRIYLEECQAEGVKAEVAFCQAMKETGFLRFGGRVDISQYNFAGIGAVDSGTGAASFLDVRTGIRAQIQHLKAYASKDALVNPCVDPRFSLVTRNTAPYIEWLGIQENPYGKGWATAQGYGYSIINDYMRKLSRY